MGAGGKASEVRSKQVKETAPVKNKAQYQRKFPLEVHDSVALHEGLGLSVTKWGIALSVIAHFSAYLPSVLSALGAYLAVQTGVGAWYWLTFVVGWVVVPIADLLIGADTYNLTPEEEKAWAASIWFRVVTWFHFPIQVALVTFSLFWVTTHDLTWFEWVGFVASVGTTEGFGIGCVHELIHRPQLLDFSFGVLSLVWSSYAHFWVEHLWNHHKNVATELDPACSEVGDIVYFWMPRNLVLCFLEANATEARIQRLRGHWGYGPTNRIIQGYLGVAAVAFGYHHLFGPGALSFFFLQGFIAALIVENTNFIEHYGLRRAKVNGEYERVGWFHAWDTPELLSNTLLFKIQRHPDHHTNAGRPYQILRTYKDAPTLPTGYAGMIALSWFPPLFRMVMDWRVPIINSQAEEWRSTGKVLGKDYPFPGGARAVSSRFKDTDVEVLPAKLTEEATHTDTRQNKAYGASTTKARWTALNAAAFLGIAAAIAYNYAPGLNLAAAPTTLYQRLGEHARIVPLVKDIVKAHATDPLTAEYFKDSDLDKTVAHVINFFGSGTGGPEVYTGRSMIDAHKDMGVTHHKFLVVCDHVLDTMEAHGYPQAVKDEVLAILYSMKGDIIE